MRLNILMVALGGAAGAVLRYLVTLWAARQLGAGFPYGTLIVNLAGCLTIGVLLELFATRVALPEPTRLLLVTGLLGGLTTFSSFGYEVYALASTGRYAAAAAYLAASVLAGLAAVAVGAGLVRLAP